MELEEYEGLLFIVPDPDIKETCIDYWFDEEEKRNVTENNPLIPKDCIAIARDPGDNLIALNFDGKVIYIDHETNKIIELASSLDSFLIKTKEYNKT